MANAVIFRALPFANVLSSSTAAGYLASNIGNDHIGTVWRSNSGAATQSLTIDLGADMALDTITLHGLKDAQASWQLQVELATAAQGQFTGAHWDGAAGDLVAGAIFPHHGRARGLWQKPAGAPASARYIRLTFSALANAAVQVARVCVGQNIALARNFQYGAPLGVRPLGSVDFSPRGVLLRRKGAKKRGLGLTFRHAFRDEVERTIQPLLEQVGNDEAVAMVIDPEPSDDRQGRIYYGFLTGNLGSVWARPGGFEAPFTLVAMD